MPIRVWRATPRPAPPQRIKATPQQPKPKPLTPTPVLTAQQRTKLKQRTEMAGIKARADAIYRAIQEGRSAEEIIAHGFDPKWVYRYLLKHAAKYRRWRQAVALFESGVNPVDLIGKKYASPTKLARWYTHWKEHGAKLPAVIPTGCDGVE